MAPNLLQKHWPTIAMLVTVVLGYLASILTTHNQIIQQTNVLNAKMDGNNAKLSDAFASLDKRTTKLEGAVKALGDNQSDPLKGLVHDLLASAANALPQKPDVTARAINVANSLIATLKKEKRTADAEYFESTVSTINELSRRIGVAKPAGQGHGPELKKAVYLTTVSLAEYRSAIEPSPSLQAMTWIILTPNATTGQVFNAPIHLDSVNFDFSFLGKQVEAIKVVPPLKGLLSENVIVSNAFIKGGNDVLDGFHWQNVTFIGAHIIYRGGEVELRNVRFINCTFDVPYNEQGGKLVNYAALANQYLVIPG